MSTVKVLFQKWLLLFVAVAFLIMFCLSWTIQYRLAVSSAQELLRSNIQDARNRIDLTERNLRSIMALSNQAALAKARAFARLVSERPALLKDFTALEAIRKELDVDELHVSDGKGILIASIPRKESYIGYDMGSAEQSAEFMPALRDRSFELVQPPQENGSMKVWLQYAGVARQDEPGIVQIGYRAERIKDAAALADPAQIATMARIGQNGRLLITRERRYNTGDEHFMRLSLDREKNLCLAVQHGPYLMMACLPESEMMLSRDEMIRYLVLGYLVLFVIIFCLVSKLLQIVVIKGIYSVNGALSKITAGRLEEKVAVQTTSEFADLSQGINAMVDALKQAIEKEAQRLDAELEMGRTIQASVLPTEFPSSGDVRITAQMRPAKEVGGDFYDYFTVGDHHVVMLIADVSGKGLTAALYMMSCKAMLKDLLRSGKSPAEAFEAANRELCRNNRAHMFLTAFAAKLDTRTGELLCVNAGHNPPLLKRACSPWEYLRIRHSVVLGALGRAKYQDVPVMLSGGERLLLYTDGVTEAMNPEHRQYGETRLQEFLASSEMAGQAMLDALLRNLSEFAAGTPQSDDITMLSFDYTPGDAASSVDPVKTDFT